MTQEKENQGAARVIARASSAEDVVQMATAWLKTDLNDLGVELALLRESAADNLGFFDGRQRCWKIYAFDAWAYYSCRDCLVVLTVF